MSDAPLLSVAEAAALARRAPATIRSWTFRGHLTAAGLDVDGRPMYAVDAVLDAERAARQAGKRGARTPRKRDDSGRFSDSATAR